MNERQKILVIDDAPLIHRLVRVRLNDLHVQLLTAETGHEGLALARTESPDLILLDVNLRDMNGFDLCYELKHDPQTSEIPVIFLTGADDSVDKVRGFSLGAVDYVVKPFDPAELRARVRSALKTKALMDLLTAQAQIDGLTELHNRGYFEQRLANELLTARRYGRTVGLLLVDLDHFKEVNDQFGHPKGDQILRRLAMLLRAACRQSDVPCRYGGDEFALLLPEATIESTRACGDRLIQYIQNDQQFNTIVPVTVTASLGAAAALPHEDIDAPTLVHRADEALYASKRAGRNQLTFATV